MDLICQTFLWLVNQIYQYSQAISAFQKYSTHFHIVFFSTGSEDRTQAPYPNRCSGNAAGVRGKLPANQPAAYEAHQRAPCARLRCRVDVFCTRLAPILLDNVVYWASTGRVCGHGLGQTCLHINHPRIYKQQRSESFHLRHSVQNIQIQPEAVVLLPAARWKAGLSDETQWRDSVKYSAAFKGSFSQQMCLIHKRWRAFWIWTQSMRYHVTLQGRLSLAEPILRMLTAKGDRYFQKASKYLELLIHILGAKGPSQCNMPYHQYRYFHYEGKRSRYIFMFIMGIYTPGKIVFILKLGAGWYHYWRWPTCNARV